MCVLMFKSSQHPDGKMADVLALTHAFAGRRCLRLFRHSHDNVFLNLREYSFYCACSCSKVPSAPMGDSRFDRCLQGGGVAVSSGTVAISSSTISGNGGNSASSVRAHALKSSHCPDGKYG
jgi:hypothetical protein